MRKLVFLLSREQPKKKKEERSKPMKLELRYPNELLFTDKQLISSTTDKLANEYSGTAVCQEE